MSDFKKDCFGTFDSKRDSCGGCTNNGNCEEYKPILDNYMKEAMEKGKSGYIDEVGEKRKSSLGKAIGYGITLLIIAFVFVQIARDI